MGSKQSVVVPPEWSFLQITFFGTKNHPKIDIFKTLDGIFEINQKALICLAVFRFEIGALQKKLG